MRSSTEMCDLHLNIKAKNKHSYNRKSINDEVVKHSRAIYFKRYASRLCHHLGEWPAYSKLNQYCIHTSANHEENNANPQDGKKNPQSISISSRFYLIEKYAIEYPKCIC